MHCPWYLSAVVACICVRVVDLARRPCHVLPSPAYGMNIFPRPLSSPQYCPAVRSRLDRAPYCIVHLNTPTTHFCNIYPKRGGGATELPTVFGMLCTKRMYHHWVGSTGLIIIPILEVYHLGSEHPHLVWLSTALDNNKHVNFVSPSSSLPLSPGASSPASQS